MSIKEPKCPYALVSENGEIIYTGKNEEEVEKYREDMLYNDKIVNHAYTNSLNSYFKNLMNPEEYNKSQIEKYGKDTKYLYNPEEIKTHIKQLMGITDEIRKEIRRYENAKIIYIGNTEAKSENEALLELFFSFAKNYCSLQREKCLDGKCYLNVGTFRIEVTPEQYEKLIKLFDEYRNQIDLKAIYRGLSKDD